MPIATSWTERVGDFVQLQNGMSSRPVQVGKDELVTWIRWTCVANKYLILQFVFDVRCEYIFKMEEQYQAVMEEFTGIYKSEPGQSWKFNQEITINRSVGKSSQSSTQNK